ncbi:glycosyltransferase family 2 protein [Candidatus Nomurabacteria bacterium]|nr:MAG: glycosyltransferase family 2 protein [Candidatus Nomurabacteria bacterium]
MLISIVIPVYNEKNTILNLLQRVKNSEIGNFSKEIIVVDDCSNDGTREILKTLNDPHIKVFYHAVNIGKGSALRTGFSKVNGEIIIVQDADLEYDPSEYMKLLSPIEHGASSVVYGSRYISSETRKKIPFGTWFVTKITNILYSSSLTDEPTCYKVFRKSILEDLDLQCERFEFCPEFTAKVLKKGVKIFEVPISYKRRTKSEGKKLKWFRDGCEAVWTLIRYRF